jgi:hypothetical protein|uniref:Uncharacterized protein n=1 Tax=viral metagenome TaxID=1070528 RepID=A0A6C0IRS4_9ZZZZ
MEYQYNAEKTMGGCSLKNFINENITKYGGGAPSYIPQSLDKFSDLIIPAGLIMQPQGANSSMNVKPVKVTTIPDQLFDSMFQNVSKQPKHNKTRKIRKNH